MMSRTNAYPKNTLNNGKRSNVYICAKTRFRFLLVLGLVIILVLSFFVIQLSSRKGTKWLGYENKEYGLKFKYPSSLVKTNYPELIDGATPKQLFSMELTSQDFMYEGDPLNYSIKGGMQLGIYINQYDNYDCLDLNHSDIKNSQKTTINGLAGLVSYDYINSTTYIGRIKKGNICVTLVDEVGFNQLENSKTQFNEILSSVKLSK